MAGLIRELGLDRPVVEYPAEFGAAIRAALFPGA